MAKQTNDEGLAKRKQRLEAMSQDEWHDAIRNFWRWFEKVKEWQESHEERPKRPTGPSMN